MASSKPTDAEQSRTTVIIADDHALVRDGIRMVLEGEGDVTVVAEVDDAESARRRTHGLRPDILILDLHMPGPPPLPMISEIATESPDTAVIVLTMQTDPAFAREALRLGARGYVVKDAAARDLVEAIREVRAGRTYVTPQIGAKLATAPSGPPGGLTPREAEILGLIALGHTNPEIADKLVLSVRTVETHRAAIQRKLGTTNRAELVAYARSHGLDTG